MPVYNQAAFVRESVDSVLCRTWRGLELIVVDDGSTGESGQIVKRIAGPRIRLRRRSNRGLLGVRNAGMALASGEYIAFLVGDDVWLPSNLIVNGSAFVVRRSLLSARQRRIRLPIPLASVLTKTATRARRSCSESSSCRLR